MKQNKQGAPYWRVSLANLCRMLSSLRQEAWSGEDEEAVEEEEEDGKLREASLQLLEELYNLQHICGALQSREERVRCHCPTATTFEQRAFYFESILEGNGFLILHKEEKEIVDAI